MMGANRERSEKLAIALGLGWPRYSDAVVTIERAIDAACAEAVKNAIAETREKPIGYGEIVMTAENFARHVESAVAEAVAAEREACAKIAEDDDFIIAGRAYATAEDIAKRIRARSTVKP